PVARIVSSVCSIVSTRLNYADLLDMTEERAAGLGTPEAQLGSQATLLRERGTLLIPDHQIGRSRSATKRSPSGRGTPADLSLASWREMKSLRLARRKCGGRRVCLARSEVPGAPALLV